MIIQACFVAVKNRKTVKRILTTETLTRDDNTEQIIFYTNFILKLLSTLEDETINVFIICYPGYSSSQDLMHSSTQFLSNCLCIEIAIVKETLNKSEISSVRISGWLVYFV